MKIINYLLLPFIIFIFSNEIKANISNSIIVKVGNEIVTSLDLENEILTNLVLSQQKINQENINQIKNISIQNLINRKIKEIEIKKFDITEYNKIDLNNYLDKLAQTFNSNSKNLKEIFNNNKINYNTLVRNYEIELLWNTLIFKIYINQTNVNLIEVENEINLIKDTKSKEELEKIKNQIINKKKEEKLNLFSRSHFSNLENSIAITFK